MLHTRRCQCWRYVTANCPLFTNLHILLPFSLTLCLSLFFDSFDFNFELILSHIKFSIYIYKKRTQIRKLQTFLEQPSRKYFMYFFLNGFKLSSRCENLLNVLTHTQFSYRFYFKDYCGSMKISSSTFFCVLLNLIYLLYPSLSYITTKKIFILKIIKCWL